MTDDSRTPPTSSPDEILRVRRILDDFDAGRLDQRAATDLIAAIFAPADRARETYQKPWG